MNTGRHLLLYDGVCGLCSRIVDFVIRHDRGAVFSFAAIQSDVGSQIMSGHGGNPEDLDTLALVLDYQTDPKYLDRGEAVVALLAALGGIWRLAAVGKILPRRSRDWAYSQIAVRRYRAFGELEACRVPTADVRSRFLDAWTQ